MSLDNTPPSRWATGTAPGNAYNPLPGDLAALEEALRLLAKHRFTQRLREQMAERPLGT